MSRLSELRSGARLRDAALGLVCFVALLVDAQFGFEKGEVTPLGVVAGIGITVPLAWRTASPRLVLALVAVGVFACLFTLKSVNTVVLAPMIAAYTVAAAGQRIGSVATGVVLVGLSLVAVALVSGRAVDGALNATLLVAAVVAGDAMRTRRALVAAEDERRREHEAERLRAAERRASDERLRIAQEVHDVVGHAMVAISVQAGVAAHLLDPGAEQARSALVEIKRTAGVALDDLRSTLGLLRGDNADGGAPTAPVQVLTGLPELAVPLRAAGIEVELRIDPAAEAAPTAVGSAGYRIVQEALTNTLRHASARRVIVAIEARDGQLLIDVHDDGSAAEPAARTGDLPAGSGHGVPGMRERATAIGGFLLAGPDHAGGWRVQAGLPLL